MVKSKIFLACLLLTTYLGQSRSQNILAAYNACRGEYGVDNETYNAIRSGDFSIRSPLIECFGECIVKRAGFMNDDLSFNQDTIQKFVSRFIRPKYSAAVYEKCTKDVVPILCSTAFDVYQCIYENAVAKWGQTRRG
ncbi:general odorant-binding protein 56d-like [Uranotaenia lowii]|uniref:general odorant-binding protein 56d-like n=1 Tax=Uranotaenia lowii TaxID=190385 RepID=UPI00247897B9|nr:general odorant-binding protein 56d-like [Uranotaenia lowii]